MSFREIHISAPSKLILHGEHAVVYGKTAVAASLDLRTRMTIKIPNEHDIENGMSKQSCFNVTSDDERKSGKSQNEVKNSNSMGNKETNRMVTVNFPDIGIKESWKLDIIQTELLEKRPKNIYGCDNHCSKCWSTKDFYQQNDGSVNEAFLRDICAFLKINKADLRMQSLVCFFYLYSHLCGPEAIPLNISIESDIPIGAGLGSSAALSVCLSAGLLTIQDLKESCISCKEHSSSSINLNQSNGVGCEKLKLICDFAYLSEKILHGRPSGIDNTASTYGGLIQFQNFKVVLPLSSSNNTRNGKINSPKMNILLVNTNVPRNTKMMVQKVANRLRDKPYQVQETMEEIDTLSKSAFDLLTKDLDKLDIDESNVNSKWGQLISRNHHLLAVGLGVSHSKLDAVCKVASRYDLNAKLTGAGGGGYAFVILPTNLSSSVKQKIKTELEEMDCSVCETTLGASGGVKINVI